MHRFRHGTRQRDRATLSERDIVRRGYDAIAERYASWRVESNPAEELVRDLDARLPDDADVLELGCGNGTPGAVVLAQRHRYTGVDISAEQLARARTKVPGRGSCRTTTRISSSRRGRWTRSRRSSH